MSNKTEFVLVELLVVYVEGIWLITPQLHILIVLLLRELYTARARLSSSARARLSARGDARLP